MSQLVPYKLALAPASPRVRETNGQHPLLTRETEMLKEGIGISDVNAFLRRKVLQLNTQDQVFFEGRSSYEQDAHY